MTSDLPAQSLLFAVRFSTVFGPIPAVINLYSTLQTAGFVSLM